MTIARTRIARRRQPALPARYRAAARAAKQRRARRRLSPILSGLVWGLVLGSAALIADTAAVGVSTVTGSFGSFVTTLTLVPVPAGEAILAETTGLVGAAPLLDGAPQFTKDAALVLQGLIPSFGRAADRKVAISLNGGAKVFVPFDANGHFALPLTLADGTTQLTVTVNGKPALGAAANVAVALASYTVKPGGFVNASITVTSNARPVAGQQVSLQVGVVAIGTAVTDPAGHATITFAAPPNEGIAQVVVLAGAASGSALLTVAK